eukprot:Nk52_evm47s240 gene=Nk52_evmTU47s240
MSSSPSSTKGGKHLSDLFRPVEDVDEPMTEVPVIQEELVRRSSTSAQGGNEGVARLRVTSPPSTCASAMNACSEKKQGQEDMDHDAMGLLAPPLACGGEGEEFQNQGGATYGYDTHDAVPATVFYRNEHSHSKSGRSRPTMQQLRNVFSSSSSGAAAGGGGGGIDVEAGLRTSGMENEVTIGGSSAQSSVKFGWIEGVFVRCLLNIWGVMLFIRLSWVVGQAGIGLASVIILLSAVVTVITTLSMSAICTNGEVRGGGAYFMISRSLGAEFGGAIGIVFSLANAVAVALYVVGFAETFQDLLEENGVSLFGGLWDIRFYGVITITLLLGIAVVGMSWESKVQVILLGILLLAIVNFMVGTFIPHSAGDEAKGFVGYGSDVFRDNWGSFFEGESFFSVFAVFFPAATGILAGANMSGDLKDAQRAIPKGTLWAILITSIVYLGMAWMIGSCYLRALGPDYGLLNDYNAMRIASAVEPIITAGIFAATLSSALVSLVSAPRVFQAVCRDKLFPNLDFFAYGKPPNDEPIRGYFLTYIISVGFILIGELNAIAPILSNFFLMAYALINYSCFAASLSKSPGWRPYFKYYNEWVALFGSALCLGVMFVINWWTALITLAIICGIYKYIEFRKPNVNWGSAGQARSYVNALQSNLKLEKIQLHVKNFRPQFLLLSGNILERPDLVKFGFHMSKGVGLLVAGDIIQGSVHDNFELVKERRANCQLVASKIKGFQEVICAPSLRDGAVSLMQLSGLGKLKPNTVLLGFKYNWKTCSQKELDDYVGVIHDAFDMHFAVGILKGVGTTKPSFPFYDDSLKTVPAGSTIDVWWMVDDGGLTILLPYILSNHSYWKGSKLRVMTAAGSKDLTSERVRMTRLLRRFRIDAELVVVDDVNEQPSEEVKNKYREILDQQYAGDFESKDISGADIAARPIPEKCMRYLKLGQLIETHSSSSQLVVMTLPIPRATVSSYMYLSWLDIMSSSKLCPPVFFVRGNQESVLTFYS